jgi:decaprenylphospho-beta-D-erythro-pentofuranosid-2-ulose 2-reductase
MVSDNFTGPATALTAAVSHLMGQGHGTIVVIGSVAGLRPRRSNYVYGSAKAGLDAFTRGLQDATTHTGIHIHLIRPGFVTTKMTTGLTPAPFATTAEHVANAIVRAVRTPHHTITHIPRPLGPLFRVLGLLPTPLWRLLSKNR